ncbi:MAG TPA: DUF6544 family protein [Candidatus Limnocylindria bacterium]
MTIPHDPGVPEAVARWRDHALGIVRDTAPSRVRLHLEGELSRRPGSGWTSWSGTQDFAVDRLGFRWQARLSLAPLVSVIAFDELSGSTGSGGALAPHGPDARKLDGDQGLPSGLVGRPS